ncbi:hypothetical protein JW964_25315 [candidate division KSB1 bacterium]|nr:hypothetical protein [candidate division KSB1 bacterium]
MKRFFLIIIYFYGESLLAQVPDSWFVVRDPKFCVAFPGKPNYTEEKARQGGYDVIVIQWSYMEERVDENFSRCFMLFFNDYPVSFFKNFLKAEFLDVLSQSVQADSIFSNKKKLSLPNYLDSGVEVSGYNFKKFHYSFIVRFYVIGDRLYRLYASETDSLSYDARLFLNAFEINSK